MQQNYRLTVAYDGTRFFGWERQPGKDTIQGKLEAVLGELQGAPVNVIGAGRTDAGVHARAMTANVVLDVAQTPEEIRDYMRPRPGSTPGTTRWARPIATPVMWAR